MLLLSFLGCLRSFYSVFSSIFLVLLLSCFNYAGVLDICSKLLDSHGFLYWRGLFYSNTTLIFVVIKLY
ncbi:unnamed protein product [Brassica napus]|uniref:(rape) hypothetical protein n=1 Tax=Brassica napus TaxID=3708 RepID=A0A816QZD1_BRANA|nr:unnamed protein product [Brassica napus]